MNKLKKVVEIGGIKVSIDKDSISEIKEICIGSHILVLAKSYSGFSVCPGIVTGFADNGVDLSALVITIVDGNELKEIVLTDKEASEKYTLLNAATPQAVLNAITAIELLQQDLTKAMAQVESLKGKIEFFKNFINSQEGE